MRRDRSARRSPRSSRPAARASRPSNATRSRRKRACGGSRPGSTMPCRPKRARANWRSAATSISRERHADLAALRGDVDRLGSLFDASIHSRRRARRHDTISDLLASLVRQLSVEFSRVALFRVKGNRLEGEYQIGFDETIGRHEARASPEHGFADHACGQLRRGRESQGPRSRREQPRAVRRDAYGGARAAGRVPGRNVRRRLCRLGSGRARGSSRTTRPRDSRG